MDPDPEPLPPGGYDDRELPKQPASDSPRCHVCGLPRGLRHGVLFCRIYDAPPLTDVS